MWVGAVSDPSGLCLEGLGAGELDLWPIAYCMPTGPDLATCECSDGYEMSWCEETDCSTGTGEALCETFCNERGSNSLYGCEENSQVCLPSPIP